MLRRFSIKHEVNVLDNKEKTEMVNKYLTDIGMGFTEAEINNLVNNNNNQSILLNELIRTIALKIAEQVS